MILLYAHLDENNVSDNILVVDSDLDHGYPLDGLIALGAEPLSSGSPGIGWTYVDEEWHN